MIVAPTKELAYVADKAEKNKIFLSSFKAVSLFLGHPNAEQTQIPIATNRVNIRKTAQIDIVRILDSSGYFVCSQSAFTM